MHKIVNGVKVEMSPEEEQVFLADQALSAQQDAIKKAIADAKMSNLEKCWEKVFASASLTDEEKQMLKQNLGIK